MNLKGLNNNRNLTMSKGPPGPSVMQFNIFNIVICFLALVLNLVEASLIISKRQFKPFERILLSLCCAGVSFLLLYIIQKFYEKDYGQPIYGKKYQHLIGHPLEFFAVMSSITNIIVLGIDRLIAVRYPLKHAIWMRTKNVNLGVAGAWIGGIILSVMSNINRFAQPDDKSKSAKTTTNIIFSGVLFSSGFIITIIYTLIIVTVTRHRKVSITLRRSGGAEMSTEIAVTATCVLVVVAFSICSYSYGLDLLINENNGVIPFKTILLNALLDPIVYFFMGYLKRKLRDRKSNKKIELHTISRFKKGVPDDDK